jgi:predicted transcriptional regulator of viral defense system
MPVDRRGRRRRLFHLAADQGGLFTAAQAREVGYSHQAQAHHVSAGNWERVGRGLFRLAESVPEPHDDLIRWTLWSRGRAIVSHESALAVLGIGEFESPRVHLTVPPGFSMRDEAVVLHRAELPLGDSVGWTGFRTTTAGRSLIDVAAAGAEEDQLARAIADAVDAGHVTLRRLRARAGEVSPRAAAAIDRAIRRLTTTA